MDNAQAVGGGIAGLTLATEIIPGDQISVVLTGTDGNGIRQGFTYTFNAEGHQINPVTGELLGGPALVLAGGGGDEPVFDVESYKKCLTENLYDGAADISRDFQEEFKAWQGTGGNLTVDALRNSVLTFMQTAHNVKSEDHTGFVIKENQVQVRAPARQGAAAGLWVVQMAPTWG